METGIQLGAPGCHLLINLGYLLNSPVIHWGPDLVMSLTDLISMGFKHAFKVKHKTFKVKHFAKAKLRAMLYTDKLILEYLIGSL